MVVAHFARDLKVVRPDGYVSETAARCARPISLHIAGNQETGNIIFPIILIQLSYKNPQWFALLPSRLARGSALKPHRLPRVVAQR